MILDIEKQIQGRASKRKICRVLHLPRSSFYQAGKPSPIQVSDQEIGKRIACIFKEHRSRYGHRRIRKELSDENIICSPSRVGRLMKERGLKAIQPRNFIPKTSDGKASKPSPNLLENSPLPSEPNRVWIADITYIPTQAGWLYLAAVMDLCTRKIVGWKLAEHIRSELVIEAFDEAINSVKAPQSAIFHSDRGSQYSSNLFRNALSRAGFTQSMSARSNPYDNAWMESFFGTLKRELLQQGSFENFQQAKIKIFEYINAYYNTRRKHSALNYLSPLLFEKNALTGTFSQRGEAARLAERPSRTVAVCETPPGALLAEPALSGSY